MADTLSEKAVTADPAAGKIVRMDDARAQEPPANGQPMLLTFLVALPFPCPVPHGAVVSRLFSDEVSGWGDTPVRISPESPDLPDEIKNRMFVSLKFWQAREHLPEGDMHVGALMQVASTITGKPFTEDLQPEVVDSYRTVVEMVTVQEEAILAASGESALRDCLDRCFSVLSDVSSMARLVKHNGHPVTAKEQVSVALWFGRRSASQNYDNGVGGLLLLSPPAGPLTEVLDDQELNRFHAHLDRLWSGSPLELAMDRSVEASTFMRRDGDYGNAVIQAALSSEIVLDSTLALLLWEEQLSNPTIDKAVVAFDDVRGGLTSRVRREYAPRLGGTWDSQKPGPVQNWSRDLARLRGRVVHRGYRPTEVEAAAAMSASDGLLEYIKSLLASKVKLYPRTALLILGEPGLRRLGGWKAASRFVDDGGHRPDDWFGQYSTWRSAVDAAL